MECRANRHADLSKPRLRCEVMLLCSPRQPNPGQPGGDCCRWHTAVAPPTGIHLDLCSNIQSTLLGRALSANTHSMALHAAAARAVSIITSHPPKCTIVWSIIQHSTLDTLCSIRYPTQSHARHRPRFPLPASRLPSAAIVTLPLISSPHPHLTSPRPPMTGPH